MDKRTVITKLHAMIVTRLFSSRPWLADKETCAALWSTFNQMGLEEIVPGETETYRNTDLGREHQMDLIMAFTGYWCEWEIPWILENYGLIDEIEYELISDRLEAGHDPERVMLPFVRRAYLDFYNPSRLLN